MIIGRAIGWALLILAIAVLGRDLWAALADVMPQAPEADRFQAAAGAIPLTVGDLWVQVHPASLPDGPGWLMRAPAMLALALPGALLLLLCRRRTGPRR